MKDTIERQDAIGEIRKCRFVVDAIEKIRGLPSVQPEIIRCKDCKYNDYNWRRMSVKWLPCMDVRTGSNWFCGSAERLEE